MDAALLGDEQQEVGPAKHLDLSDRDRGQQETTSGRG